MRLVNPREPRGANAASIENALCERLRECVRTVLGPAFRVELRGALALRRIPKTALRSDDVDDLRAETLLRLYELVAEGSGGPPPMSSLRCAVSAAVHHHFCREIRRQRVARRESLDTARVPPREVGYRGAGGDARPDPSRENGAPAAGPVVTTARAHVGSLLTGLAEDLLGRRAGGSARGADPSLLDALPGALRWLRQYEGDRAAADLTRDLAASAVREGMARPAAIVKALRASAQWEGRALCLARLAHSAVAAPADARA
jgi:hypothetical protein